MEKFLNYWADFKNNFIVPVSKSNLKEMKEASTLLVSYVDFRLRHET